MALNILQWNIISFTSQLEYLEMLLYNNNPDIVCLQETNFKNENISNLKRYNGYNKNRTGAGCASGGVATYVKKSIMSKKISLQTNLEAVAIL